MINTDAVVIGAGPVGLFQVFQLGLLGLKAEVIDALPQAGGQCIELYPDKPIYDVPGVPLCTGRELAQLVLEQARPFMPVSEDGATIRNLHLGQLVSQLASHSHGYEVHTTQGLAFRCRVVFVAAGAGAFVPRGINVPALEGAAHVHYTLPQASDSGPAPWVGQHLVVAGGGDEALSTVIALAQEGHAKLRPARLSLLHRRDQFQAEAPLATQVHALIAQGRIDLVVGQPIHAVVEQGTLRALQLLGTDGQTHTLALDHLLIRQGLSPKLGSLTRWGMALEHKQVTVSADTFESTVPGIYAVGDINTYPGKKRLLLCGFHEATLAAHAAAVALNPDAPSHLLYTTTSPLLHQRLGLV